MPNHTLSPARAAVSGDQYNQYKVAIAGVYLLLSVRILRGQAREGARDMTTQDSACSVPPSSDPALNAHNHSAATQHSSSISRRDLLKTAAVTGAGAALAGSTLPV